MRLYDKLQNALWENDAETSQFFARKLLHDHALAKWLLSFALDRLSSATSLHLVCKLLAPILKLKPKEQVEHSALLGIVRATALSPKHEPFMDRLCEEHVLPMSEAPVAIPKEQKLELLSWDENWTTESFPHMWREQRFETLEGKCEVAKSELRIILSHILDALEQEQSSRALSALSHLLSLQTKSKRVALRSRCQLAWWCVKRVAALSMDPHCDDLTSLYKAWQLIYPRVHSPFLLYHAFVRKLWFKRPASPLPSPPPVKKAKTREFEFMTPDECQAVQNGPYAQAPGNGSTVLVALSQQLGLAFKGPCSRPALALEALFQVVWLQLRPESEHKLRHTIQVKEFKGTGDLYLVMRAYASRLREVRWPVHKKMHSDLPVVSRMVSGTVTGANVSHNILSNPDVVRQMIWIWLARLLAGVADCGVSNLVFEQVDSKILVHPINNDAVRKHLAKEKEEAVMWYERAMNIIPLRFAARLEAIKKGLRALDPNVLVQMEQRVEDQQPEPKGAKQAVALLRALRAEQSGNKSTGGLPEIDFLQ